MGRLQNKVTIVTGGARGMGAATARLFAAEGAKVVIADLLDADGAALAAEIGDSARFVRHDVTDETSWQQLIGTAESSFGAIDVLVNNAGILMFKTIAETARAEFQRVLDVNLVGCFLGTKLVGARMTERGRGSIVNISSVDGMKAANGLSAYNASKWAVRGFTKAAAMEFGHKGVRVNSVHPGGIDTAMGNPYAEAKAEVNKRYGMVPMQRVGEPVEVAYTSLFLASDESSYLCGAEIAVDGGMLCGQYYVGFPGAPGV
ncbi:glucose 1-dehydrogenase [Sinimarinibacterium flocculans]|uniref:3alpha(Or 20beta)-hydroxysteroid dehydrogenase n=1 Tax=Sinimarinibacterium flocculans TaxID=985250 RepID=A0A318EFY3_9GAMM|nr:glucose 1-dehydrogenase [Sinimarinibacterium flocculans]PXV70584.1 3alpha(or 20beta)-hydroxysteroid dehydrogenase [Sinimarinibacterium flocculans]